MRQRLTELTGVGARNSTPETHVPTQRARNAPAIDAPRQRPGAQRDRAPAAPARARRCTCSRLTGSRCCASRACELLAEIVALVRERPEISTGALLEHFADRDEAAALQKLAVQTLPGEEAALREEFLDTMAQLEKQVAQQRIDELQERLRSGGFAMLSVEEKSELLELQGMPPRS